METGPLFSKVIVEHSLTSHSRNNGQLIDDTRGIGFTKGRSCITSTSTLFETNDEAETGVRQEALLAYITSTHPHKDHVPSTPAMACTAPLAILHVSPLAMLDSTIPKLLFQRSHRLQFRPAVPLHLLPPMAQSLVLQLLTQTAKYISPSDACTMTQHPLLIKAIDHMSDSHQIYPENRTAAVRANQVER